MKREGELKKARRFKKIALGFIAFFGLFSLILIVLFIISEENNYKLEQEIKELEVTEELFGLVLNITSYCAESNNITYQELVDGYIEREIKRIFNESEVN